MASDDAWPTKAGTIVGVIGFIIIFIKMLSTVHSVDAGTILFCGFLAVMLGGGAGLVAIGLFWLLAMIFHR